MYCYITSTHWTIYQEKNIDFTMVDLDNYNCNCKSKHWKKNPNLTRDFFFQNNFLALIFTKSTLSYGIPIFITELFYLITVLNVVYQWNPDLPSPLNLESNEELLYEKKLRTQAQKYSKQLQGYIEDLETENAEQEVVIHQLRQQLQNEVTLPYHETFHFRPSAPIEQQDRETFELQVHNVVSR